MRRNGICARSHQTPTWRAAYRLVRVTRAHRASPLYVASAEADQWSDPRGEFLALKNAEPVYRLLGVAGLGLDVMPAVGQPVGDVMRYHVTSGKHDMPEYDWAQDLNFADKYLQRPTSK